MGVLGIRALLLGSSLRPLMFGYSHVGINYLGSYNTCQPSRSMLSLFDASQSLDGTASTSGSQRYDP